MAEVKGASLYSDPHFADSLLQFLVHDREFLQQAGHLVTADDFSKRSQKEGNERQVVARMALDFYNRYREPLGKMLVVECQDFLKKSKLSPDNKQRLTDYAASLCNGHKRVAPDAMLGRVRQYRTEHRLSLAMQQMMDLIENGVLTTDQFLTLARKAVEDVGPEPGHPVDIFSNKQLESRIARRLLQRRRQRFPVLLIDPIDRMVRIIARKHLGLVMAPYGRGKSLFLIWLALAYTLQGWNTLFFTLEDPQEDVEDRFDAAITSLPLSRLADIPDKVRIRFQRYKKLLRARLKVIDGTDGSMTIGAMENIREQERNRGFTSDVTIVDYDDEIRPANRRTERRMEFSDIYKDYRAYLARIDNIGWTASQTGRQTGEMKIIRGKHIAEDISKLRKASMAMSLGQGEWGPQSIFVWVEKHRYDMEHVGANIVTDKDRMLFYDRDKTLAREKVERERKESAE
jgi:hypothetical protein